MVTGSEPAPRVGDTVACADCGGAQVYEMFAGYGGRPYLRLNYHETRHCLRYLAAQVRGLRERERHV